MILLIAKGYKFFFHLFLFKIIEVRKYLSFHNKSDTTRTILFIESLKNFFNIAILG